LSFGHGSHEEIRTGIGLLGEAIRSAAVGAREAAA
jgi:hypothetical protein